MSKILCVFATLLMIVALTPATASADPLVITSGTLSVTGLTGGPFYGFTGLNFFAAGGGEQGSSHPQMLCSPCVSGAAIDLGGFFAGSSTIGGSATINGTSYPIVGGTFILSAPTIIVPNSTSNLTLTSPFVFSGDMHLCPSNCGNSPPFFTVDLVGSGTATLNLQVFFLSNGNPIFQFKSVTYDFQTPEPMSILLLGGGLVGLAAELRRRRWRR
ncbi:MAG TPA: PEP-CTERM sorting domain-containing protein [Pyrinomonadaceae bacterium]|nr:PEP-CTERM sorting domain-containing protein [Pyrinomonadaceae bacterium]